MYLGYHEEGDKCPQNCQGKLEYKPVENCSCHINPPCSACTDNALTCNDCGWKEEAPAFKYVQAAPGLTMCEYKPKPLDKTKIDYRIKLHTHMSMIKEGCHPKGTLRSAVEDVVRGTFGGRFEHFTETSFKYVAYTD